MTIIDWRKRWFGVAQFMNRNSDLLRRACPCTRTGLIKICNHGGDGAHIQHVANRCAVGEVTIPIRRGNFGNEFAFGANNPSASSLRFSASIF